MNNHTADQGHLYAIEFSSGTVKVGQSRAVDRRIATHLAAAGAHNVTADRIWVSESVDRLDERERELLAFCHRHWAVTAGGEYFRHADVEKIIEQAARTGIATLEVRGRPAPVSESIGTSWGRAFKAHAAEAPEIRAWVRKRVPHEDAALVAHELFVAVLSSGADVVEIGLSTAGARLKVTATGDRPLPLRHSHGPGWRIIQGVSRITGTTPDELGLWAELEAAR